MLDPRQRRDLLRIEQSRDAVAIADAIRTALHDNPDANLIEASEQILAELDRGRLLHSN